MGENVQVRGGVTLGLLRHEERVEIVDREDVDLLQRCPGPNLLDLHACRFTATYQGKSSRSS